MRWPAATGTCIASELNDMISCPSQLHKDMRSHYGDVCNVWAAADL